MLNRPARFRASALDRQPAVCPGVDAAVEIDRLATLGIEKLSYPSGASTHCANADDPVVDLIEALHQLVHGNVPRARDAATRPLVFGAYVKEHPAIGHPSGDLARLNRRHLISK